MWEESSSLSPQKDNHTDDVCLWAAGEFLSVAEEFLEQQIHPTVVTGAYHRALEDMLEILKEIRYARVLKFIHQVGVKD